MITTTWPVQIKGFDILSRRQNEAMSLKANGLQDKQIAERMLISKSAVQIHLRAACKKLNAQNTTHGVALAIAQNLIDFPKPPNIASLEHHAFTLGLFRTAEDFLLDRLGMQNDRNLPRSVMADYEKFLTSLVQSTS